MPTACSATLSAFGTLGSALILSAPVGFHARIFQAIFFGFFGEFRGKNRPNLPHLPGRHPAEPGLGRRVSGDAALEPLVAEEPDVGALFLQTHKHDVFVGEVVPRVELEGRRFHCAPSGE